MAIDLDAARAARREALGRHPTVVFDGETFELPVEIPAEFSLLLLDLVEAETKGETLEAHRQMLGIMRLMLDGSYEAFMAHRPSYADLLVLMEGLGKEYGGNPPPSAASSATTSRTSRRTSRPNTASTSAS